MRYITVHKLVLDAKNDSIKTPGIKITIKNYMHIVLLWFENVFKTVFHIIYTAINTMQKFMTIAVNYI